MGRKAGGASPNTTDTDFIDRIYSQIERDFGDGVVLDGNSIVEADKQIIPIGPCLDIITGGGIVEGSWVGITGNPKHYKSSTALCIAANAQKEEYGSRPVFYIKSEGRLSQTLLRGTRGLRLEKPFFTLVQSREGKILNAQEYLSIITEIIKTVPRAVVIIDSISALCDEREMNDGVGHQDRGSGAKLFSQFLRLNSNIVPVHNTIVIGITHLISNTSGMGAQYNERAARAWLYQKDYDLKVQSKQAWKQGETGPQIGSINKWVCNVTPLANPGMSMESYIRYGVGVDVLYELITLAIATNLIRKSGAWMYPTFLDKHGVTDVKFQGSNNLYKALNDNEQWAGWLREEVTKMSGTAGREDDEGERP